MHLKGKQTAVHLPIDIKLQLSCMFFFIGSHQINEKIMSSKGQTQNKMR